MKLTIRNPFIRPVAVRYWHVEARGKKRCNNYIDNRFIYFDAPTKDAAASGLRKIIISQSYTSVRYLPVIEKKTFFPIPVWSLAYWFNHLQPRYMEKRGFFLTNIDEEYYS